MLAACPTIDKVATGSKLAADKVATRNEIITQLFSCKKFNDCLRKVRPMDIQDDLKSEVMLIMLQQPDGRIRKLHEHGNLSFFAIRVLLNMVSKSGTGFIAKYMMKCEPESAIPQMQYDELNGRVVKEQQQDPVYELLIGIKKLAYQKQPTYLPSLEKKISWYKQYILSLYMKLGSYRLIEKETGIPWESCYKTVKETMVELKQIATECHTR